MTGRDVIMFILQHNLENTTLPYNGKMLGLITIPEAAAKYGVGIACVRLWCQTYRLPSVVIDGEIYIYPINFNTEPSLTKN